MSDTSPRDQSALLWNAKPPQPKPRRPSELLFAFRVASDRELTRCELRHHGGDFGWEVLFLLRGELAYSRGALPTREIAVAWAEAERDAMIKQAADIATALGR